MEQDKIELHTQEWGQGEVLLLLHGNEGNLNYFKRQVEPFSQGYRVIACDTRGHGDSPRGTAPFTLDQFAQDVKEMLDKKGVDRCHILGFSDGGNIALLFALAYPSYVDKLILNGANWNPWGIQPSFQLSVWMKWVGYGLGSWCKPEWKRKWELLNLMAVQPHLTREQLQTLTMPVLIVVGERDLVRESHTRAMAQAIPNSQLVILPGDHFVARRNWEAFNPVVLEFLRGGASHGQGSKG